MVTPSGLDTDLEATSCCCSSTQRSISGLGSFGPLRLRVWGVLWGVLGLRGLCGLCVWPYGRCTASLENLSPCFVLLSFIAVPVLRLAVKGGLANDCPRLKARRMASCLSWFRLAPQAPHWPSSLCLSLDSMLEWPWTRRLSRRKANRSLVSCRILSKWEQISFRITSWRGTNSYISAWLCSKIFYGYKN